MNADPIQEPIVTVSTFKVEAANVDRYCAAIGDFNPLYRARGIAPPSFAVVPIIPSVVQTRRRISQGPGLHAQHALRVFAPMRPGMEVTTATKLHGVMPTRAGLLVTIHTASEANGIRLNEQQFGVLIPSDKRQMRFGASPESFALDANMREKKCIAEATFAISREVSIAYAHASGDLSDYTIDDEAARRRGLPAAIIGGICTMALATRAAVDHLCGGDPESLALVALRFSGLLPIVPDQQLTVRFWSADNSGPAAWRFEGYDRQGSVVVTNGVAETRS